MIYLLITMTVLISSGIFISIKNYSNNKKEKTVKKLEFEIGPTILK